MTTDSKFSSILDRVHLVQDINAALAGLSWDRETYAPAGSLSTRSEHMATLSLLAHQYLTDQTACDLARSAKELAGEEEDLKRKAILQTFSEEQEKASKLPASLIEELSRSTSLANEDWKCARQANDFSLFAPSLRKLIHLKRQEADCRGYTRERYDALLDLYEPGLQTTEMRDVFESLEASTKPLLDDITKVNERAPIDVSFLLQRFESSGQLRLAKTVSEALGFDYRCGRLDLSAHPFCTAFAPNDVRLTTRVRQGDLRSCLFGVIHETGHGLYEQGIDPAYARTFVANGASLGWHESQSLLWENIVARSAPFCKWVLPQAQREFPAQLANVTAPHLHRALNVVQPSLIRVEADELTYNMHILLRFEIELDLLNGQLPVEELPTAWNDKMLAYLGQRPPDDNSGCLQDIHWSLGDFGYFPTYTLGKLYAASLWQRIQRDIPELETMIEEGEFHPLREWLRHELHAYGRSEKPKHLLKRLTKQNEPSSLDFIRYMKSKIAIVYGV